MSRQSGTRTNQHTRTPSPLATPVLQRKCACGQHTVAGSECAECRKKRLPLQRRASNQSEPATIPPIVHDVLRSPSQPLDPTTRAFMEPRFGHDFSWVRVHTVVPQKIQTRLTVNEPGDEYEQEADRVTEQVMRMPEPRATEGAAVSRQASDTRIERVSSECEEEVRRQPTEEGEEEETLEGKEAPRRTPEVTPDVQAHVNAMGGGGQPLPESVRTFFEPRFGHDFSQVRVHTGARADETARRLQASAFTVGHDIVFGAGQYAPETTAGRFLLAHELAHAVQQGASHEIGAISQDSSSGARTRLVATDGRATHLLPQFSVVAPRIQRRVEILDDPLAPGFVGPPARTGADFIRRALEDFTDLNLSFSGNFLEVDAATRAAVLRERRERPTPADVRARLFIIPGVSRAKASAALKLAQVIIDTRATARIQPIFGEAGVLMGAFPAAGGGGIQRIDINDVRRWRLLTTPANEPVLRIMAWLRGVLGRAAAARPAVPIRTDTAGGIIYHETVESFRAALAGAGTPFPGPHRASLATANVALRAMGHLERLVQCPNVAFPSPGGETRIRFFWRRRRGAGREDRFAQDWFLSGPPAQALVWVDPPILIGANVATGDPCPP